MHHESKYGGRSAKNQSRNDGKTIRGGSSLFGSVDQAIFLDHRRGGTDKQRVLKTLGRRSSPHELIIELVGSPDLNDPHPYKYRVLGTPGNLTRAANKEAVLEALTDQPQSIQDLASKIPTLLDNQKAIREASEELFKEGKSIREGKGRRRSPRRIESRHEIFVSFFSFVSKGFYKAHDW